MDRYIGIDVHRDSTTIVVLSATGKRTRRDVVDTNGRTLIRYLRALSGTLHVCIEESPWSEWLHELLSPLVAELVVYQSQWSPRPEERRARRLWPRREAPSGSDRTRQLQGSVAPSETARVGSRLPGADARRCPVQEPPQKPVSTPWRSLHGNDGLRPDAARRLDHPTARLDATDGRADGPRARLSHRAQRRSRTGTACRITPASRLEDPRDGSGPRADPHRAGHRHRRDTAPLPVQAPILGLLWLRSSDQHLLGLGADSRRLDPCPSRSHPRLESQSPSGPEIDLQECRDDRHPPQEARPSGGERNPRGEESD